jgi:hypothetical protein
MRATIGLAAILILSACGGSGSAGNEAANAGPAATPSPAAPGRPPAGISISTPQAKAEIGSGAAAANWPEGVPPYPGAAPDQSVNVAGGAPSGAGRILGFRTSDSPQQVIAFYAPAVGRSGYSVANQMDLGQSATLTARRGQGEVLNITATRTGDVTQVQIIAAAGR